MSLASCCSASSSSRPNPPQSIPLYTIPGPGLSCATLSCLLYSLLPVSPLLSYLFLFPPFVLVDFAAPRWTPCPAHAPLLQVEFSKPGELARRPIRVEASHCQYIQLPWPVLTAIVHLVSPVNITFVTHPEQHSICKELDTCQDVTRTSYCLQGSTGLRTVELRSTCESTNRSCCAASMTGTNVKTARGDYPVNRCPSIPVGSASTSSQRSPFVSIRKTAARYDYSVK